MRVIPSKRVLILLLIGMLGLTLVMSRNLSEVSADTEPTYKKLKLLAEVLETIQSRYVEPPEPEALVYGAIKGMVSALDPHSAFLTPDEFKELQIETSGRFSGIGIEITIRDGVLTVVAPIEGTPADKAGIQAGDKIIKVDGKLTKQMSLMDAVKSIRGAKGSEVVLTILRAGENKLLDYSIVRDVIPLISVKSRILDEGYGYLRVSSFQSRTVSELKKALEDLEGAKPPLKGLILDLRNNPGGLLNQAVEVADLWLEEGLIVYTEGRDASQNMKFHAHPNQTHRDYPMVLLVNRGSASASEIVAGALKDHNRAVILGTQTFGKGSVQTIIPFEDNSGLRLTTARYYTPSGLSIQVKGITPDVVVEALPAPQESAETKALRERDLEGHMENHQAAEEVDPEKQAVAKLLRQDNQLREALSLLKAWQVFSRSKTGTS